jgi:flagellar protein FlaG
MADQVNPLGGLMAGKAQTLQSFVVPPQPKSAPARAPDPKPKASGSEGVAVSKESLEAATKSVEEFLAQSPSELRFSVDKDTGLYFFKIVDQSTGEIIRQVPAEEVLKMAKRLRNLDNPKDASGVILDENG